MRLIVAGVLVAALSLATGIDWWRGHNVGPVQRGARLAASRGCLACHGAPGRLADPDGSRGIGTVPSFEHDDVTAYAHSLDELREWILDGRPKRLRDSAEPQPLLRMPAWRGRLAPAEVDALVAWVSASADFEPLPHGAESGRATAAALGCFACHGPQGRGDTPNPGSLKGYIPSWSGADFPELARDDSEIREWIRDGAPRRLRDNPAAAFFMRRQAIRMPAFGDKVGEDDVRRLTTYIRWLRTPRTAGEASLPSAR